MPCGLVLLLLASSQSSVRPGIKMADAEKMATEMGFAGAQAKEAATRIGTGIGAGVGSVTTYQDSVWVRTGVFQVVARASGRPCKLQRV